MPQNDEPSVTVSEKELTSLRRRAAIADRILRHNSVEISNRENPENRTFDITIYCGSVDPIDLFAPDQHGHIRLTAEIMEALMARESAKTEVFRFSRKKSREAAAKSK